MHPTDAPALRTTALLADQIEAACGRIAPSWPLDQLIAVNPHWGWVAQPITQAAAQLGLLNGTRLAMDTTWAAKAWRDGGLQRRHLLAACELAGVDASRLEAAVAELVTLLEGAARPGVQTDSLRLPLVSDLATDRVANAAVPVRDTVVHQVSQHCAAWFDEGQAQWGPDREASLWASWRPQLAHDRSLHWRLGRRWITACLADWPDEPVAAIGHGLDRLGLPSHAAAPYLTALLLDVNGWASWCAYRRWQSRQAGHDDDTLAQLLAIRVAWEVLLQDDQQPLATRPQWREQWVGVDAAATVVQERQAPEWLLQSAMELAWREPICRGIAQPPRADPAQQPAVQAVFCIDVRSEVFRRALEAAAPSIATRGFAGFFGLPIAYAPVGGALVRPQLPGLLAPSHQVGEQVADVSLGQALRQRRQAALQWRAAWSRWRGSAASAFSFVETCGVAAAAQLLADSRPSARGAERWEDTGLPSDARGLTPALDKQGLPGAGADLAHGILRAMGLVDGFAPLVLLVGHGSQSANNPHAAGLDCGACGGQAGDVNARVLADLLNDTDVRIGLRARGVVIPDKTHFLPALHNTTTDDVSLFDLHRVPASLAAQVDGLRQSLKLAAAAARQERAPALGLRPDQPAALLEQQLKTRANDWSQVRPEWGLAGNAGLVIAPRRTTRHLALEGRVFLHDYDWRTDADRSVLTLLMTAPMVVAHWINLQYHASTLDNRRYGSGNKLLHNVVGGRIGVFEGNGGDLRIGLPLQSLHDGREWRHTPLRLSVFIEAPQASIDEVVQAQEVVRQLVVNGWLHLLCIDPETRAATVRTAQGWHNAS